MFSRKTLEKIAKALIQQDAKCVMCHTSFKDQNIENYDHSGGIPVKGLAQLQWVYMTCQKCGYQSALWKIFGLLQREAEHNE